MEGTYLYSIGRSWHPPRPKSLLNIAIQININRRHCPTPLHIHCVRFVPICMTFPDFYWHNTQRASPQVQLKQQLVISSLCRREGIPAKKSQKFTLRQPIHILSKPYPWDSLLGGGGIRFKPRKTVCQLCANLVGISWHLLTNYATSVPASLIKTKVNN